MTTKELESIPIEEKNSSNNISRFLYEIALQLSRANDLREEQWNYDQKRDLKDDEARDKRDDMLAVMGKTVKEMPTRLGLGLPGLKEN